VSCHPRRSIWWKLAITGTIAVAIAAVIFLASLIAFAWAVYATHH
jgi:hypothetical protein